MKAGFLNCGQSPTIRWIRPASLAATLMFVLVARAPADDNKSSLQPTVVAPAARGAADPPALETALILDGDSKENWFAVFAPDGKTLATGGAGGVLKLWDLASGNHAVRAHPRGTPSVAGRSLPTARRWQQSASAEP